MAKNKVQELQKQILELTEAIEKNGKATKEQAKQLEKLEKKYSQLGAKVMPQYRKSHEQVTEALERSKKRTLELGETKKGFTGKVKTAIGTLGRYALAFKVISAAQNLFNELTSGSVKQAIDFEKSLANLGAVAGVSGKNLETLGRNALNVAGSTTFTATEVVGLQTSLAKLGFTSEQIIQSTQGIANAAQALGSDLDFTAEQIGKVINQFDLLVQQSDFVGDVLVTTINKSALSFEGFATAIQYVGPIARNLGLDLQQTAGAMAVLADNGFTASRIGTGLRGILTELGKSSADAELSLKELAKQNISLSEAVDLVGKRNASQLITLLNNIDAIEEGNQKYYEQGRAVAASAQQINTLSGQMALLNSAFKETQIRLGEFVLESDLVLDVLGLLSREAEGLGRAMKNINETGFEKFNEGVESVLSGEISDKELAIELVARRTGKSIEDIEEKYKNYKGVVRNIYDPQLQTRREALVSLTSDEGIEVAGLITEIGKLVEERKEELAITRGQEAVNSKYKDSVDALVKSAIAGNNVNKKANELNKEIQNTIDSYSNTLKTNTTLSKERRTEYESSIKALQRYREQLTNVIISEEQIRQIGIQAREKQKAAEAKRLKEKISDINKETAETVAAINERAALETFVAKTAEERAKIEAQRQADVSEAYSLTAEKIGELNAGYRDNKSIITDAVEANEKLAKILGSQVVKDVQNTIKDYSEEIKNLNKQLEEGQISQEEYNAARDRQYDGLKENIEAFKELNNVSPEVAALFDKLAAEVLSAGYALDTTSVNTKKAKKDFQDFLDELEKGSWADYAKESVEALGESLSAFNDTSLENLKNSEQAKLDVVKNRYETEENILKAQLENQLITESQYRKKQRDLKKAQLAEENSINQKIFEAEKKQDRNDALLEGAEAIAQSYIEAYKNYEPATAFIVGSIGAGIAAAQSSAQVAAINKRKFFPKKFADGGVVNGPSHEQGGVPFTIQGQSGYEMEGGEFIVNKKATAMHRDLLERINSSYATQPTIGRVKFAQGGLVPSNTAESVDYLKAIAEATTSTAIGVNKPVRAFVANKDLRSNDNERRLRDRNDRI